MDLLTRDDLRILTEKQKRPCVSIFMPTHRMWPEVQQEPIRLKNLLRMAEEYLLKSGLRAPEAKKLLEPPQIFFVDTLFWKYQSDGLAMFLSPNMFRYYRLPINFEELVVVTGRFNIKPLLPLFRANGRFLILVLSQNKVKLFQGTRYTISEINLEREEIPKNMREALKYADIEKQQQYHTGTPPISSKASVAGGERAAIFHGHREDIDEAKKNILEYFNKLDKGLHELLRDERVPLVLVGVDYLLPIYREVNSYPYLIKEGVMGSPRTSNEQELHKQAWAIVQPYFEKAQEDATTKYRQFSRTKHTSNDIKEVALAAYQGRVESLFVAIGVQQWGIFDENTGTVCLHQKEEAGDGDILDFVAAHTILKGGAVYAVEPKKVPDNSLLAAVLRY